MKKLLIPIGLLLLIIGATPYTELNQLAIIDMIGLEYNNQQYHLYLTMVEPIKEENKTENKHTLYQISGKSLGEVFLKAKTINNKTTYYQHLALIILDRKLLTQNSHTLIQFLKEEFTQINYLLVGTTSPLEELLKVYDNHQSIEKFIKKEHQENGSIIPLTFDMLAASYLDDQQQAYLPLLELTGKELKTNGFQILDSPLTYSEKQARISYLLTNKISTYPLKMTEQKQTYQIFVQHLKTKIHYQQETVHIKVQGTISSSDASHQQLQQLKPQVEKEIQKNLMALLKQEQQTKTTTTSIMNTIFLQKRNPDTLKDTFTKSPIKIKITLKEEGRNFYDES